MMIADFSMRSRRAVQSVDCYFGSRFGMGVYSSGQHGDSPRVPCFGFDIGDRAIGTVYNGMEHVAKFSGLRLPELATQMSNFPSLLKSPVAIPAGFDPLA